MADLLLLFAKRAAPGAVKTRLCPPLEPDQAADLYAGFVADVVAQARALAGPDREVVLCLTGEGPEPEGLDGLQVWEQRGAGLGERMAAAFEDGFGRGATRIVLRNTDSPLLPAARIEEAFEALGAPGVDAVLGPDNGGGYYLVGLSRPLPDLFAVPGLGRHRGHDGVHAATCRHARAEGLALGELRHEDDVDGPADLAALRALPDAAFARAPRTLAALRRL
ncbi:MAG: glycosyltransferase [Planctomycetota bacterium]